MAKKAAAVPTSDLSSEGVSTKQVTQVDTSTRDEIEKRAYKRWEAAGRPISDGLEFWVAAEQEVLQS